MQVLLHRQGHGITITTARNDDADFMQQGQAPLKHTGRSAQRSEGLRQVGQRFNLPLTFAVVAQRGRFQNAGQQCGMGWQLSIGRRADECIRRTRHASTIKELLFAQIAAT